MADFAVAPLGRDQLVLFPEKLDDAIAQDHPVRLLDEILNRLEWKPWEDTYVLVRGQPPIHPKVIAGAILYGIHKGIRTSRSLEEALAVRNDFRWLAQGRSLDHTTISKFRVKNAALIKELYIQIALVARSLGYLPLATLGFDGTRMRANNRRSGSRTPDALKAAKAELAAKFDELNEKIALADQDDEERLGKDYRAELDKELADVEHRSKKVGAALAELQRLEAEDLKVPNRLPITDPESRIMPNKEGGYAPNYTPLATVDVDSGFIVSGDVISTINEDKQMIPAVKEVMQSFGLAQPPAQLLADGMMSTGENLVACKSLGIDFYSPIQMTCEAENPAIRQDPSQPVAEEDIARLPIKTTKHRNGTVTTQFQKDAFIYDKEQNCYWCPAGKALPYNNTTSETEIGRTRYRLRFLADPSDCAACPLKSQCVQPSSERRTLSHEQHEEHRIEHAKKMSQADAKEKYARRRHAGERPFATIKQQFGARRFLTRGLAKVKCEWSWLTSAFNLHRLMGRIQDAGRPPPPSLPAS